MRQQIHTVKTICDRCGFGKEKPATETRKFTLDGVHYELELCGQHAQQFDRELGQWALLGREDLNYRPFRIPTAASSIFSPEAKERDRLAADKRAKQQAAALATAPPRTVTQPVPEPAPLATPEQVAIEASGWVLTPHARERAEQRHYTEEELLLTAAKPTHTYRSPAQYGERARIHVRGECVVAVDTVSRVVITVMPRKSDPAHYDNQQPMERIAL